MTVASGLVCASASVRVEKIGGDRPVPFNRADALRFGSTIPHKTTPLSRERVRACTRPILPAPTSNTRTGLATVATPLHDTSSKRLRFKRVIGNESQTGIELSVFECPCARAKAGRKPSVGIRGRRDFLILKLPGLPIYGLSIPNRQSDLDRSF